MNLEKDTQEERELNQTAINRGKKLEFFGGLIILIIGGGLSQIGYSILGIIIMIVGAIIVFKSES